MYDYICVTHTKVYNKLIIENIILTATEAFGI